MGVLLVGGASSRFGSPKALARFRGETLADRAWRTLGDACDERLAVGKGGELKLPFDVLDDGYHGRAAIFGVIAGLRAARHETVVFLPVDCPLVTPELLRAFGTWCAVPQTGPLPGAYDKGHVRALERRLVDGNLSLRGVNPNVLQVRDRLLLNVNTPAELLALEQDLAGRDEHPA